METTKVETFIGNAECPQGFYYLKTFKTTEEPLATTRLGTLGTLIHVETIEETYPEAFGD